MIKVTGTLVVRTIHGRNGPFNVGRLESEIGEFVVKDAELDQFTEGRYEGEFGIEKLFPTSYVFHGSMTVEVRAILGSMSLEGVNDLPPDDQRVQTEPDPIDEPPPVTVAPAPAPAPAPEQEKPEEAPPAPPVVTPSVDPVPDQESALATTVIDSPDDTEAATLFGHLWPLNDRVAIDPTVDRKKLRQQIAWLKAQGYTWKMKEKVWVKKA